ncbi:MAG: 50S ribosomal protein L29 [Chlamydiales bacterium]
MRNIKELRAASTEELKIQYLNLNKENFILLNELAIAKKIEAPHKLRQNRKKKARILTILQEKTKAESK